MDQYSIIFNQISFYKTLFIKILSVTEYSSINEFMEHDNEKYKLWNEIAIKKYGGVSNEIYLTKACFFPEFSKIIGIGYATVKSDENGDMIRKMKCIDGNENDILTKFFYILYSFYNKVDYGYLCGHNITNYEIPFLIKRGIHHNMKIPVILKNSLTSKPWESSIIDTINIYKFNGNDFSSLKLISKFLNLKYDNLPVDLDKVSHIYWNDTKKGDNWYHYDLMNQLNLTIQVLKKLKDI